MRLLRSITLKQAERSHKLYIAHLPRWFRMKYGSFARSIVSRASRRRRSRRSMASFCHTDGMCMSDEIVVVDPMSMSSARRGPLNSGSNERQKRAPAKITEQVKGPRSHRNHLRACDATASDLRPV
eukprot:9478809-Pyramimonas_sp.AAC.1